MGNTAEGSTAFIQVTDLSATTLATIVIALFTIAMFILQYRQHAHSKSVAHANYQLALYEKRIAIFFQIEDALRQFMRDGRPSFEEAAKLRYNARLAHFLFPPQPLKFVEELVTRALRHRVCDRVWEPLRERSFNGEELSPEEITRRDEALKEMHEIEDWFHAQIENSRLQSEFEPFLKLPETL
ncbi:hypothetical protein ACSSV1_000589 [Labrenzia sp. MBR-25]